MCGRYYVNDSMAAEIGKIVRGTGSGQGSCDAGDVCPSQTVLVITGRTPELSTERMGWGMPQYGKNGLLINARAETVLEKKMFRDSVLRRRCVIPARGFYEWDSDKNRAAFYREGEPVLYMAGFYNLAGGTDRFVILTVPANDSVRPVHDRMPLLLDAQEIRAWIYEDRYLEAFLRKTQPPLRQFREYEQQDLFRMGPLNPCG